MRLAAILAAVLLWAPRPAVAAEDAPICVYQARATEEAPRPELQPQGPCGSVDDDGTLAIEREHLAAFDFEKGPASLFRDGTWYYASRGGRTVSMLTSDNGADVFSEGLARNIASGKVGFIDHDLQVAIPAMYDFAWPFHQGNALVCMACRRAASDGDGHTRIEAGRWGYIDRTGKLLVPIRFSREDALARRPGRADASASKAKAIRDIDVSDAAKLISQDDELVILDIRTPAEFKREHIKNAINIDFMAEDFVSKLSRLDKDKSYLMHCQSGGRSGKSLTQFKELGFKRILHLDAGFAGWLGDGQEVER
jgi:rhodanese-related sulfurtransferase